MYRPAHLPPRVVACLSLSLAGCGGDMTGLPAPDMTPFHPTPRPPLPAVPQGDGVVMSPMTLVTIVAENDALKDDLIAFGAELVQSHWWKAMSDVYQLGAAKPGVHAVGPPLTANITDGGMQAYIKALIASGAAPAPDDNTVYMLYLPDQVAVLDSGQPNTDCSFYEGYHDRFKGSKTRDNYAFAQRCYHDTKQGLNDVTNTASHEIIESATDPDGKAWTLPAASNQPWADDPWLSFTGIGLGTEIADLCAGTAIVEGKYEYQRIWSNAAAAAGGDPCVPPIADPYYGASPAQGWTTVAAGATVTIPIHGWSTGPAGDWYLEVQPIATSFSGKNGFQADVFSDRHVTVMNMIYPSVNNGLGARLTVTAPASATPGSWASFYLYSTGTSKNSDYYHIWPVGVYIP